MTSLNLLDFVFGSEDEQRRRSLERAIERQSSRTPSDVEYGLLSSAMRSRTPARSDYPEVSATLGGIRPREVDAAYEMGRQEGMKAAALSSAIPSVMPLTEDEVVKRGLQGLETAAMNPESYKNTFLKPADRAISNVADRASPYIDDLVNVARTGLGSIYTGFTDPSVVQPSEDDTVLRRALKSGVGGIQSGLRVAGDVAALPFDAGRDVGMYLGSSAENPYVPQYIKDAAEAYNIRSEAAAARKAVEEGQAGALDRAREITSKKETSSNNEVKKEDKANPAKDDVLSSGATLSAAKAVMDAASSRPQGLLENSVGEGILAQSKPSGNGPLLSDAAQHLQDVIVAYGRQKALQPQLVTAADLAKLRPINAATILAGARDEQIAREQREEKSSLAQRKLNVEEGIARLRRTGTVNGLEYNVLIKAQKRGFNSLNKTEKDIYNAAIKKPEILQIMEAQNSDLSVSSGNTANRYLVELG